MPLNSMTGFARIDAVHGDDRWHWEVRGVNARGLDIRMRLGAGFDRLEPQIRAAIAKRLKRGNVSVSLNFTRGQTAPSVRINEDALAVVRAAAERLRHATGGPPVSAENLLGLRGVLEQGEDTTTNPNDDDALDAALIESFERALDAFCAARRDEGVHLEKVMNDQIDEIERLKETIESAPNRTPAAITERIRQQISRITDAASTLDEDRLHQEAILIATRSDVEEELKRLDAHIAAARELLNADGSIGRKFDFLAQEFNRETNTICSKSIAVDITQAALSMKVIVDQMREQSQNIE